jgi:hypothetical protein
MGFEIIEKGDEKTTYKMELNDFKSKQLDFIEISNG